MSTRSEYYASVYDDAHASDAGLSYEASAAVSFSLCLAVFVGAVVVAWRKAPAAVLHHAALPFEHNPNQASADAPEVSRE